MSAPVDSLARDVGSQQVLTAIGVATPEGSQAIRCPVCNQHQLRCYDDAALHGDWLFCQGCEFAGDPLQLAQAAWGEPLGSTIEQLLRIGIEVWQPGQIDQYERDHLDHRQQLMRLWNASRRAYPKLPEHCLVHWVLAA